MDNIKTVPLNKLQEYIIRPQEELMPIGLFLGNVDLERIKALWNFFCGLKETEIPNLSIAAKLSKQSLDFSHTCGLHHALTPMSIQSFASRIWYAKRPEDRRLREYIWWFTRGNLFQLTPIPIYNPNSRREWRGGKTHIIYAKQPFLHNDKTMPPSFYPFIATEPQDEHNLLLAVHNAVPNNIPETQREDICQDLIVAILEGSIKKENLIDEVPKFIKKGFKQFPTKYAPISLDTPYYFQDGSETSFTMVESLSDDNILQRW